MKKLSPALSLFLLFLTSCAGYINTLPTAGTRPEGTLETVLRLPAGLQVVSVDYDAELYLPTSNGSTSFEGEIGRAFINVFAVDRETGTQYLLIYENLEQNSRPLQVIRFEEE
ncbi:hypothetical protein [Nafulsella turpanensis]|uniref:hypothetical protein n=1 Tax=Nafulsella turpanensis TaxID=1265690 RepID=UPI00034CE2A4|nr:hypothetical protein [Nafulsella turpanensis]